MITMENCRLYRTPDPDLSPKRCTSQVTSQKVCESIFHLQCRLFSWYALGSVSVVSSFDFITPQSKKRFISQPPSSRFAVVVLLLFGGVFFFVFFHSYPFYNTSARAIIKVSGHQHQWFPGVSQVVTM